MFHHNIISILLHDFPKMHTLLKRFSRAHSFARLTGRLGINVCVEFVIRHYANPPHPVARPNCSLERHNKRN